MITDRERIVLKQILFSPEWRVVEHVVELMCEEIRSRPKVGDSEWETVKNTVRDEGEERGIRRFIQQVSEQASQAK